MKLIKTLYFLLFLLPAPVAIFAQDFYLGSHRNNSLFRFEINNDAIWDREHLMYAAGFGLHYHYYDNLSVRLTLLYNSDILKAEALPKPLPGEEKTSADNSYGTLVIDYHF